MFIYLKANRLTNDWKCLCLFALSLVWMKTSSNWKNFRLWLFSIILLLVLVLLYSKQHSTLSIRPRGMLWSIWNSSWLTWDACLHFICLFSFLDNVSLTCNVHGKLTIFEHYEHICYFYLSIFRNLFDLICDVFF